jgi:transposase
MSKAQVTVPLGIPEVRVLKTEMDKSGQLVITIESTKQGTACRWCGGWIIKFHGHDEWVVVRHLAVFGRPSYLRYRPKRYQCQACDKTTTQGLGWQESNSPHTMAYDDHLLVQLVNATVEDVRLKEGLTYDRVLGALERRISAETDWSSYEALGVLGLDEIALKKGHRDFVTIVSARLADGRVVVLGVLADRQKESVVAFLRSIPMRLCQTIESVCCDMYEGYIAAVQEELPGVQIVIDRFHVTQHYHRAADGLRKQELQRLKSALPPEEYQQLQGSMWAFRKKPTDLKPKERQVLRRLFTHAPNLKQAYQLREQLTTIFEQPISKSSAQTKLRHWIKQVQESKLTCFDDFIQTLQRWWEEISNYFVNRHTSGFVEGLNNKLKVLKRRCYGIYNLQHLFQRIYLDLEGYRMFSIGPPYVALPR